MSSYEFTGKSVKEAIERACEELKIDEALLEIEVLEESSKGFHLFSILHRLFQLPL